MVVLWMMIAILEKYDCGISFVLSAVSNNSPLTVKPKDMSIILNNDSTVHKVITAIH